MFSVYHKLKIKKMKDVDKKMINNLFVLSVLINGKEELLIKHKIPKKLQTARITDLIPKDSIGKIDKKYEHIKNRLLILNSDSNPKKCL